MSKILLQVTGSGGDWDVSRFTLLATELRAAGHDVVERNRRPGGDPILRHVDELGVDQLWLMAVEGGDDLTVAEADAVMRLRRNGGGVLTARGRRGLGRALPRLGSLGLVNQGRTPPDPTFDSGADGDYQPVLVDHPVHEVLATTRTSCSRIEWFPAHPQEGMVDAAAPFASAIACGRSIVTGRRFNLAVAIDGERASDGRVLGRAVAESSYHHFADYNWDVRHGAASPSALAPGTQIRDDPGRLVIFTEYVYNLAAWLSHEPVRPTAGDPLDAHRILAW